MTDKSNTTAMELPLLILLKKQYDRLFRLLYVSHGGWPISNALIPLSAGL